MKKLFILFIALLIVAPVFSQWEYGNLSGVAPKVRESIVELRNRSAIGVMDDIWYVDANNGIDTRGGKSWDKAFATLTKALTLAGDYDVIMVAPGDYEETGVLNITEAGLRIYGPGRDNQHHAMIYVSDSSNHAMSINAHHVVIDGIGFTVNKNGYDAIRVSTTASTHKVTIRNCRFDGYGSGEYAIHTGSTYDSPDIVVENCVFRSWQTGAIYANATRGIYRDNIFLMVAGKIGIEIVPNAGSRPDQVIVDNIIKGVNSTDTGIKITNSPNENTLVIARNQVFNCATPITAQQYTSFYDGNFFGEDDDQYHSKAQTYYVNANAGATGVDGRCWMSAYLTLTEAVAVATTRFDTIIMRAGDYDESATVAVVTQGLTIKAEGPAGGHHNRAMIYTTSGSYDLMSIDAHEVTIDGVAFSVIPDTKSGIVVSGSSGSYKVHIKNCRFDGWSGEYGVYLNESPDALIENCVFRSCNTAGVYANSTRTWIRNCVFHVVAAKAGIEHVPSGGNRPDNVYIDNLFSGATSSTTTAIKFTGAPNDGTIIVARNYLCGTFDVDITTITAHGGVNNYAADAAGGALIDTVTD